MTSTKAWIMITLLIASMVFESSQDPPKYCTCLDGSVAYTASCTTPGCSLGNNAICNHYAFTTTDINNGIVVNYTDVDNNRFYYGGCNCPANSYSYNPITAHVLGPSNPFVYATNGYYDRLSTGSSGSGIYNYTSCHDFAYNAYDGSGQPIINPSAADDCCTYCCTIPSTTTTTTLPPSTTTTTTLPPPPPTPNNDVVVTTTSNVAGD